MYEDESPDREDKESVELKHFRRKAYKTPKTKPEYLRPFIEAREAREAEKGK